MFLIWVLSIQIFFVCKDHISRYHHNKEELNIFINILKSLIPTALLTEYYMDFISYILEGKPDKLQDSNDT